MGGAPLSRGCDACRAQKKGCDQGKPACSRCKRLGIQCTGAGKKRWVFKHEQQRRCMVAPPLRRSPSNDATLAASSFVSILQVKDCRYDIRAYGTLWDYIPQRLTFSKALDAAIHAISCGFRSICIEDKEVSYETLDAYGAALALLRVTLDDPAQASDPNVLCAIYAIYICQGWIEKNSEKSTVHAYVIASKLSDLIRKDRKSPFEDHLLVPLCRIVISTSIEDPSFPLDPWLPALLERYTPVRPWVSDDHGDLLRHTNLFRVARFPLFFREPEQHLDEIVEIYNCLQEDTPIFRQRVAAVASSSPAELARASALNFSATKLHAHYKIGYCIVLTHSAFLNTILRCFPHPSELSRKLADDVGIIPQLFLSLMREMLPLRPVFTRGLPLGFVLVWAMAESMEDQMALRNLLREFCNETQVSALEKAVKLLKGRFQRMKARAHQRADQAPVTVRVGDGSSESESKCVLM